MKKNELIVGIVSVIVGIMVITMVMVPIISSSSTQNVTYTNTTEATFDKMDSFTLTSGAINDVPLTDIIASMSITYGLVVTDCFVAVVYLNTAGTSYGNWNVYLGDGTFDQYKVTVVDKAYSITNPSTSEVASSGTLKWAYVLSVGGEYGLIKGTFKLNESSELVYFTYLSADHGVSFGTADNMSTKFKFVNSEAVTDFVPTIDYTSVSGSNAIEVVSNGHIIAPITTTYESYGEGPVYIMVAILPIFAVIGLLVGGTFVLYSRR